jgi:importin subunit alpha-1
MNACVNENMTVRVSTGNIAGDSPQWRDHVLSYDAMSLLLDNFTDLSRESLVRNAIWTLSNFCRGKPQPNFATVQPALPVLAYMIRSDDPGAQRDQCVRARALARVCVRCNR